MLSANTSNTLMNKLGETYRNKFKLFRYSGKKVQLQSEKLLVPLQYTPVPHAEIVFLTKMFSSLAVGKNCPLCSQDASPRLQALLFSFPPIFFSFLSMFLKSFHEIPVLSWVPSKADPWLTLSSASLSSCCHSLPLQVSPAAFP